jgi:hypothetical protein
MKNERCDWATVVRWFIANAAMDLFTNWLSSLLGF